MLEIPEAYVGREQSYLKHRVLDEYLQKWGHKLASVGRNRRIRLCYVDGFAGPWKSKNVDLQDTSIAIGLNALEVAAKTWSDMGADISVEAAFVEKEPAAFAELQRFLEARSGLVRTFSHQGEFGSLVPSLQQWLAKDAALIFVDPTGWKGAAMQFIAPLVAGAPWRDVLVNVMFDHINRFKDDPRQFIRDQMRDFFGLGALELPERLAEEELFALYRAKLKEVCGLRYAADLAIPRPTTERTNFRLVVGGKSPAILELFRDIERKVIGVAAASVRDAAAIRKADGPTGQLSLLVSPPALDPRYEALHTTGLREAPNDVLARLASGPLTFANLWPALLEVHHITQRELSDCILALRKQGRLTVDLGPRERRVKDEHVLALVGVR